MSPLRLVIVAEDPVSASALRHSLRAATGFEIADGYADGRGPCAAATLRSRPDVVVLDHLASRDTAVARLRELRSALPDTKLIALALTMDRGWLAEAAAAGADAAIAKSLGMDGVGALVRAIAAGRVFHAFGGSRAAISPPPLNAKRVRLTRREAEVLQLVAAGAPNSGIAAELQITEQTVKFHLSKVYRKLGVASRTQASRYAYLHGLVELSPSTGLAA